MRHTKNIVAIVLALILGLTTVACGPGESSGSSGSGTDGANKEASVEFGGEISGEITISCYDTMQYKSFLDDAAKKFEEKYPGTKVIVETFSAMPEIKTSEQGDKKMTVVQIEDDPQGRADYINKVGTSLMSGSGADIYAMDVLPAYKYADNGQLEDLTSYMDADPDFNKADYRGNILDAVKYKGGTWFMPMDYSFNYYAYDSTLLEDTGSFGTGKAFTSEQLMDIGKPAMASADAKNMFSLYDYTQKGTSLFALLMEENHDVFVDLENKEANFNDGTFTSLLESVKEYSELGYVQQGVTGQTDPEMIMRKGPEEMTDRYLFKSKPDLTLTQHFSKDSGRQVMMFAGSVAGGVEADDEIAGIQANQNGKVPFTCAQAYGINADSQNKQTAWEFIKFLLSDDMQVSTDLAAGLPLKNSAREKKAELMIGMFMGAGNMGMFAGSGNQTSQSLEGPEGPQAIQGPEGPEDPQIIQGPEGPEGSQIIQGPEGSEGPQTIQGSEGPQTIQGPDGPEGSQIIQGPEGPEGSQTMQGPQELQNPQSLEIKLDEAQREVLRKYIEAVEQLSDQINSYSTRDSLISDMIAEEVHGFFEGTRSADEVASALQNKVELYLSE